MFGTIIHRWLRIPYTLHTRYNQKPRKYRRTVLFIHGIGNSGDAWRRVIAHMPADVRIITVDLLGFGSSAAPNWAKYDARTQARSVIATLLKLGVRQPVTIVGHSLGALVAVEVAKKYPVIVRSLVLCSPPFYDAAERKQVLPRTDKILRQLYSMAADRPVQFARLTAFVTKYKLVSESFNVTEVNIAPFISALRAAVINQTAYVDVQHVMRPITIIQGRLDPLIVPKNLRFVAKQNPHITLRTVIAGHEVKGRLVQPTVDAILSSIK